METDVACQLFKDVSQTKVEYSSYVGDDDSTTLAELVQQAPYELQKFSDIIHTKRSLGTRLYNLSSVLSLKVINYLQKCFSYCINQNKDNPSELAKAIKTIIHMHLVSIPTVTQHGVDSIRILTVICPS